MVTTKPTLGDRLTDQRAQLLLAITALLLGNELNGLRVGVGVAVGLGVGIDSFGESSYANTASFCQNPRLAASLRPTQRLALPGLLEN